MVMDTKTETGQSLSARDYGKKSRYYIDPNVKTKECVTVKPADPEKIAAYRKANPHLYTPQAIKERERALNYRLRTDASVCGV